MRSGLSSSDIKRTNQRLLLDAIYSAGITSRTKLANELNLSKPAVSDNLEMLLQLGVIEEIGESSAGPSGGRRSILLRFNSGHKYIISVNLNFSNPVFALGDLDGNIQKSFDIVISEGTPISTCMDLVSDGIRILLQSLGDQSKQVYCIAVAAPGVYNDSGEMISYNPGCAGPNWWRLDLKQTLLSTFQIPVIVYNDIKAATLGEWIKGSGSHPANLIYLSAGLGIGAGIILNGSLFRGERFNAGEVYDYIDTRTQDSSVNFEDAICMDYLKDQYRRIFPQEPDPTLERIVETYQQKHPELVRVVDEICCSLAILAYNFMNFISVSHVVFGGEYAPFGDLFVSHLERFFAKRIRRPPTIEITTLKKYAGIQGMFYLARQQYFHDICS